MRAFRIGTYHDVTDHVKRSDALRLAIDQARRDILRFIAAATA